MTDGGCRFGPRAKREMVACVAGEHARAIARSMGCSPTTVTTALGARWRDRVRAGQRRVVRATLAGLDFVPVRR